MEENEPGEYDMMTGNIEIYKTNHGMPMILSELSEINGIQLFQFLSVSITFTTSLFLTFLIQNR